MTAGEGEGNVNLTVRCVEMGNGWRGRQSVHDTSPYDGAAGSGGQDTRSQCERMVHVESNISVR